MDPVTAIANGVGTIFDVLGGGPGARAEVAKQNAIAERERTNQKTAQGKSFENIALYGVVGVVALGAIFLLAKGFGGA